MNNYGPQAQLLNMGASQRVQNDSGTSSSLVPDHSSERYDANMRARELDTVYRVLKDHLSRKQRHRSWRKWRHVLNRYPLSIGTPFLNVISFVNDIARENGLNNQQKFLFRSELLRALVKDGGYGNRNSTPLSIRLNNRTQKILYKSSEMTRFENATIGVDADSHLVLVTKQKIVIGTSVRILLQKGEMTKESALHISGHVVRIDTSKSGLHFEYVIEEHRADQTLVA
ncbi:hypothetical protein ACFL17_02455 [Pseudomonadota bacterium]